MYSPHPDLSSQFGRSLICAQRCPVYPGVMILLCPDAADQRSAADMSVIGNIRETISRQTAG
jgi:hypothetical protein